MKRLHATNTLPNVLLSLVLSAILLVTLGGCIPSVYDQPYPVEPVTLPRDEAAHRAPIEWWYYTGHLTAENGHQYGFELTFFKAYTPPDLPLFAGIPAYLLVDKGHVAHFGITDIDNERFSMAERTDFWGYQADADYQQFDVFVGGWHARRQGDSHVIAAGNHDYRIDLQLTPTKPVALHGNPPGIQSMGPGGTSYYLSYTRMAVTGEIGVNCGLLGCDTLTVTGQAWHDHQWGDFDISSYAGWDWFSLQFDDNSELMLYLIREPSGAYITVEGSYVDQAGEVQFLAQDAITVTPTGYSWESEDTGAIYPLEWDISVPSLAIDVRVSPVLDNQEMDTRASTGIVYWEGAMDVSGSHSGVGYMELTNYDLYPFGQTDENTPLKPLRNPLTGGS